MFWRFWHPRIAHRRVVAAIAAAEARTTGEIRVVVVRHQVKDAVAEAQAYFDSFAMAMAPQRNGVLILVAPSSRNFAVIGDLAVHERCGDGFWTSLSTAMAERFRAGDFSAALIHGIEEAGRLLAAEFPRRPEDGPVPPAQATEVD